MDEQTDFRVGLIVPSSNVTMEIEIPALLRRAEAKYSFHSSRMRMRQVSADELAAMDAQGVRCVQELADARCDVLAYACLVAVMVQGPGAHRQVEERLRAASTEAGSSAPVISSAGALVAALHQLGAARIAMVTPYVPALTTAVVDYLAAEGVHTSDVQSLGIDDNYAVGCIPGTMVVAAVKRLDLRGVDALVLSACVQMPSLGVLEEVQQAVDVPVLTAATATSAAILGALGRSTDGIPGIGVPTTSTAGPPLHADD